MKRWLRQGECNHCGYCCVFEGPRQLALVPATGKKIDRKYYELRGIPPHRIQPGQAIALLHAYLPCSAWDRDAKRCSIYDDRPHSCRVFPERPEQVIGTPCSYWFLETGTNRRIGGDGSPCPAGEFLHEDGQMVALPRCDVPTELPCAPVRS